MSSGGLREYLTVPGTLQCSGTAESARRGGARRGGDRDVRQLQARLLVITGPVSTAVSQILTDRTL